MPVPHTGHVPFSAGRPLAIFTVFAFEIARFALHFTQYPSFAPRLDPAFLLVAFLAAGFADFAAVFFAGFLAMTLDLPVDGWQVVLAARNIASHRSQVRAGAISGGSRLFSCATLAGIFRARSL